MTTPYARHELSNIFPELPDDKFNLLVENISRNGYDKNKPITSYQGKILDGWHRYQACLKLKVEPTYKEYDGECGNPLEYVYTENTFRRHMTDDQLAMVAATYATLRRGWQPKVDVPPIGGMQEGSQSDVAAKFGVSVRSLQRAATVRAKGVAALGEAAKQGKLKLGPAEQIAKLPSEDQVRVMAQENPREAHQTKKKEQKEEKDKDEQHEQRRNTLLDASDQLLDAFDKGMIDWTTAETLLARDELTRDIVINAVDHHGALFDIIDPFNQMTVPGKPRLPFGDPDRAFQIATDFVLDPANIQAAREYDDAYLAFEKTRDCVKKNVEAIKYALDHYADDIDLCRDAYQKYESCVDGLKEFGELTLRPLLGFVEAKQDKKNSAAENSEWKAAAPKEDKPIKKKPSGTKPPSKTDKSVTKPSQKNAA